MISKTLKFLFVSVFIFSLLFSPLPAKAVGYGTQFTTSITYMNVGSTTAQISFQFYSEGASSPSATYPVATLESNAASSLGVGAVFTSEFKGSAVVVSTQPLVATMVQVPPGTSTVKNRPLANGVSNNNIPIGSSSLLIGTALKNKFNFNSVISIQHAGSNPTEVTVNFIKSTDGQNYTQKVNLSPGSAKYYDLGTMGSQLGSIFNGSVVVDSSEPLVATVLELSLVSDNVYAFEGISGGGTTLYMPTAVCKFGPDSLTSFYAVQNTSKTNATRVVINYKGKLQNGTPVDVSTTPVVINPGEKKSFTGCGDGGTQIQSTFLGSGKVDSKNLTDLNLIGEPIIAIGKIAGPGSSVFATAFEGVSVGSEKLALPYVRWTDKFYPYNGIRVIQRTNIAVQNVGDNTIPGNQISVDFLGPNGAVLGSYTYNQPLASGAKFSVNPKLAGLPEFGYVAHPTTGLPISYGGGAVVRGPSLSSLAAVARVSTNTSQGDVAEDYTGIPIE